MTSGGAIFRPPPALAAATIDSRKLRLIVSFSSGTVSTRTELCRRLCAGAARVGLSRWHVDRLRTTGTFTPLATTSSGKPVHWQGQGEEYRDGNPASKHQGVLRRPVVYPRVRQANSVFQAVND
jgi:hypothetical protein